MTIEFTAFDFDNAVEAIQHYYADPHVDRVIQLGGRCYAMKKDEADRLAAAGVEFAYLFDHELPDGRNVIMAVPVND